MRLCGLSCQTNRHLFAPNPDVLDFYSAFTTVFWHTLSISLFLRSNTHTPSRIYLWPPIDGAVNNPRPPTTRPEWSTDLHKTLTSLSVLLPCMIKCNLQACKYKMSPHMRASRCILSHRMRAYTKYMQYMLLASNVRFTRKNGGSKLHSYGRPSHWTLQIKADSALSRSKPQNFRMQKSVTV